MRTVNIVPRDGQTIILGRCGENKPTKFNFVLKSWLDSYPQGNAVLWVIPPNASGGYYATTTFDDDVLSWVPSATDLSASGGGRMELHFTATDGTKLKTCIFNTQIIGTLTEEQATLPEYIAPWGQKIEANVAEIRTINANVNSKASAASASATAAAGSATSASGSASAASASATSAAGSASDASASATSAASSASSAESAKTAAQTAQSAAETAKNAAETASSNASTYASNASSSAQSAAQSAATTATAAQTVDTKKAEALTAIGAKQTEAINAVGAKQSSAVSAVNDKQTEAVAAVQAIADQVPDWTDDINDLKTSSLQQKENIATVSKTVENLDDAADGNLYGTRSVTATGSQTAPSDALNRAVVTACAGADTVRVHSKNLLNLSGEWVEHVNYQELPLNIANGNYVLSMDKNLCSTSLNPYTDYGCAVYINIPGLNSASVVAGGSESIPIGNTNTDSTSYRRTMIRFNVTQPMSLYVYFNGVHPRPDNYLNIINTYFGTMQIESGTTNTRHVPYYVNDYAVTRAWDGVISINDGALIECIADDEVISIDNTVVYTVKKQVAHASDLADKQDKLIAGSGISIADDGKTISSTGGGGDYVTPTQLNEAITTLGNSKQDVLTAGENISIVNNVISATGGGGSGGSAKKYVLLNELTTTSEVDTMSFVSSSSGNPYNLKKAIVKAEIPSGNGLNGKYYRVNINTTMTAAYTTISNSSNYAVYITSRADASEGFLISNTAYSVYSITNSSNYSNRTDSMWYTIDSIVRIDVKTNSLFPIGTKIMVYGID